MMELMIVRTKDDLSALCKLVMENEHVADGVMRGYDCTPWEMCRFLTMQFSNPDYRLWIFREDDAAAGYCVAAVTKILNRQVNVFDIYLRPEYRGLDLHIALFYDAIVSFAKESGVKRIAWTSSNPKMTKDLWETLWNLKVTEKTIYSCEVQ